MSRRSSEAARPDYEDKVLGLMIKHDTPGFLERDGTAYRVIHFNGEIPVPKYLKQFVGAIAEWGPGSGDKPTALFMYRSEEEFGIHFANIDIVADQV